MLGVWCSLCCLREIQSQFFHSRLNNSKVCVLASLSILSSALSQSWITKHSKSGLYLVLLFGVTMSYAQIRSPYAPRPVGVVNVLPRFLDPEDDVPSRLGDDKNSPSASTPSAVTLPASLKGSNVDTEMASRVNDWPDAHKPFWFVNAQHINRHVSQQPSANQFGKDTPSFKGSVFLHEMASADQAGLNKTWELSLYELNRTPQPVIIDNTEIAVSPRSLHREFMCPICLDILKKTMTTKECLHRFCSDCIITALRSGNKECPTCRKKLVSKRSLRQDPNFDLLISKIYPSRDEYEAHQERVLAKLSKSQSQAALVNSINEGIKLQSQNRPQRARKSANDTETTPNNTPNVSACTTPTPLQNELKELKDQKEILPVPVRTPTTVVTLPVTAPQSTNPPPPPPPLASSSQPTPPSVTQGPSQLQPPQDPSSTPKGLKRPKSSENESAGSSAEAHDSSVGEEGPSDYIAPSEIELIFKPHPTEMTDINPLMQALKENSVRYLKTTANASVDHLSKYLATRMALDLNSELADTLRKVTFCIYIAPTPGHLVVLSGNQTLRQVNDKFWKVNKPLEMYYSWKKTNEQQQPA
uniref:RING-type E3 ubiquitin transferase n=1 Tax=Timema poppense TaxID=170557 RepID=A0A7R9CVE5_TIMPO|nr:unnamed protein product [Timema poppensis]